MMMSEERRVSPAMRRWVKKLEAGYTIRPVRAWRKKEGGLVWRPGLFNPEGAFVQRVRLDTAIKLEELGYLKREEARDDQSRTDHAEAGD